MSVLMHSSSMSCFYSHVHTARMCCAHVNIFKHLAGFVAFSWGSWAPCVTLQSLPLAPCILLLLSNLINRAAETGLVSVNCDSRGGKKGNILGMISWKYFWLIWSAAKISNCLIGYEGLTDITVIAFLRCWQCVLTKHRTAETFPIWISMQTLFCKTCQEEERDKHQCQTWLNVSERSNKLNQTDSFLVKEALNPCVILGPFWVPLFVCMKAIFTVLGVI